MVRPPFGPRSGLVPARILAALGLIFVNPMLANASLSEPWAATEFDGMQAIASGHGRYVAVGSLGSPAQAAAWTSTDGLNWNATTVAASLIGADMTDVVATEDGFVALGVASEDADAIGERVLAWASPDGLEWQSAVVRVPTKSGFEVAVTRVADGPDGLLALGTFIGQGRGGQRLWRSADGLKWERAKLPAANGRTWTSVVSVPQGYLLLGQSISGVAYNWHSADGTTWERLLGTPQLYDVAVSGAGALVGMGYEDLWRSPKGLRGWRKVLTRPDRWKIEGANAFSSVAWDGSEFVVVGRDVSTCLPDSDECERSPLLVSLDGKTWSEAAGPDGLPGADEAASVFDVASLDDSTVVLGVDHGTVILWTIGGTNE